MLLNLSNHPSHQWSPEQLHAAQEQFCRVEDMPFPQIDPAASKEDVNRLSKEYVKQIREIPDLTAVHLMGEMSFVYALVKKLQKHKIMVVCSTTLRAVLEEINGMKTTQFSFVQFRSYY